MLSYIIYTYKAFGFRAKLGTVTACSCYVFCAARFIHHMCFHPVRQLCTGIEHTYMNSTIACGTTNVSHVIFEDNFGFVSILALSVPRSMNPPPLCLT